MGQSTPAAGLGGDTCYGFNLYILVIAYIFIYICPVIHLTGRHTDGQADTQACALHTMPFKCITKGQSCTLSHPPSQVEHRTINSNTKYIKHHTIINHQSSINGSGSSDACCMLHCSPCRSPSTGQRSAMHSGPGPCKRCPGALLMLVMTHRLVLSSSQVGWRSCCTLVVPTHAAGLISLIVSTQVELMCNCAEFRT